jgi:hypothetical protein
MKMTFLIVVVITLILGCGSSKTEAELAAETKAYNDLKTIVESGAFEFKAEVLYPFQTIGVLQVTNKLLQNTGNTAARVNLATGYNLVIKNDSAIANLPYIGERRTGGSYFNDNNVGISFNDTVEDYSIKDSKNINIEFSISDKAESYNITMKLYMDKSAEVNVNSSHRTSVRYRGTIEALPN